MNATKLTLLPSFLAVVALAVALHRSEAPPLIMNGAAGNGAAGDGTGRLALDERLAALEARLDRLAAERTQAPLVSARRPVRLEDDELGELEDRLARLESRAWSLADLRQQGFRVLRLGHDEATLAEWTEQALDDATPAEERIAAFARLRGQVRDDARDARLGALEGMLALARTTDDARVRAAVYDQLAGLAERELVAPLLESVRGDSAPEVRFAAAHALAPFRADEGVRAVLEATLAEDPDELVKDAAFEALSGQPRRPVSER